MADTFIYCVCRHASFSNNVKKKIAPSAANELKLLAGGSLHAHARVNWIFINSLQHNGSRLRLRQQSFSNLQFSCAFFYLTAASLPCGVFPAGRRSTQPKLSPTKRTRGWRFWRRQSHARLQSDNGTPGAYRRDRKFFRQPHTSHIAYAGKRPRPRDIYPRGNITNATSLSGCSANCGRETQIGIKALIKAAKKPARYKPK